MLETSGTEKDIEDGKNTTLGQGARRTLTGKDALESHFPSLPLSPEETERVKSHETGQTHKRHRFSGPNPSPLQKSSRMAGDKCGELFKSLDTITLPDRQLLCLAHGAQ